MEQNLKAIEQVLYPTDYKPRITQKPNKKHRGYDIAPEKPGQEGDLLKPTKPGSFRVYNYVQTKNNAFVPAPSYNPLKHGKMTGFGNWSYLVYTKGGYAEIHAHMRKHLLKHLSWAKDKAIGELGSTGDVTGAHDHYEFHKVAGKRGRPVWASWMYVNFSMRNVVLEIENNVQLFRAAKFAGYKGNNDKEAADYLMYRIRELHKLKKDYNQLEEAYLELPRIGVDLKGRIAELEKNPFNKLISLLKK